MSNTTKPATTDLWPRLSKNASRAVGLVLDSKSDDLIVLADIAGFETRTFFENKDWSGCDFRRSNLSGVSFSGAILIDAKFSPSQKALLANQHVDISETEFVSGGENADPRIQSVKDPEDAYFSARALTAASDIDGNFERAVIKVVEWLTGKWSVVRSVRSFERSFTTDRSASSQVIDALKIELSISQEDLAMIPKSGPLVVVANQPHGVLDSFLVASIIERVRDDLMIIVRSNGLEQILLGSSTLATALPHETDAIASNVKMRAAAMDHLKQGGSLVVFPAGRVAAAETLLGPAVEHEWNPFTAKLIRRMGATILPVFVPGQNSRASLVADKISRTFGRALLLNQITHSIGKSVLLTVGSPIQEGDAIHDELGRNPRAGLERIRQLTLNLGQRRKDE